MRVTMNVNEDLVKRADAFAKSNYLTRTAVFTYALSQFLTAQELPSLMVSMKAAMDKIAAKGTIDPETQKQLDSFDAFVKLMNGQN